MSDEKQSTDNPAPSRIRQWSRGLQGQLLKVAENTGKAAGMAEGANEKLKLMHNSPTAQKIIASATSEPAKKIAIDSLYLLLPRPVRWAHVFREGGENLKIADQSLSLSPEEAGDSGS